MKLLMKGKAMMTVDAYPCPRNLKKQPKDYIMQLDFLSLHVAKAIGFEEKTSE